MSAGFQVRSYRPGWSTIILAGAMAVLVLSADAQTGTFPVSLHVRDPGVRTSTGDAGGAFPQLQTATSGLPAAEFSFFSDGKTRFQKVDAVADGLGPTFNSNSCSSCHSQPAIGGTSPSSNPQANLGTSASPVPYFISATGPVLEARFPFYLNSAGTGLSTVADGGVHDVFVITGMSGVPSSCNIAPPNFTQMENLNNIVFRIPTPVFGLGLLETITEETIIANMNANASTKSSLGIAGVPNRSGNDGTITRFGWKAQNKSGQIFSGEAYNVEMGVTNELFPNERGNSSIQNAPNSPPTTCLLNPTPEDATNFLLSGNQIPSDIIEFSHFMRFLAAPAQDANGIPGNPSAASIANGKVTFETLGCNMCHTESLTTGASVYDAGLMSQYLSNQTVNLYSDLLVHHMGGLADGITQGLAMGDQFRTAPLWGLGQRIFFLHDGRATPTNGGLITAIQSHDIAPASGSGYPTSEAHTVIVNFNTYLVGNTTLQGDLQDMMNFLRSL